MAKQPQWVRDSIAAGNRFHYKKKSPYRHNTRNLLTLAALLAGIVGVLSSGAAVRPLVYVPAAAATLGLLYFALIVLVLHEAAHGMFLISGDGGRARFWNRLLGWSVSLPFAMHFRRDWEEAHIRHHLHPIEEADDPLYRSLPMGAELFKECVKLLFVPGYMLLREGQPKPAEPRPARAKTGARPSRALLFTAAGLLWLAACALVWLRIGWAAPVAAILGLQVASAVELFKLALEHGGDVGRDENRFLRARTSLFSLRRLLLPLNISLHFEHHLNYCVPWYDLPRYHRALLDLVPGEIQPYVFNRDIRGQLYGRKGSVPKHVLAAAPGAVPSHSREA